MNSKRPCCFLWLPVWVAALCFVSCREEIDSINGSPGTCTPVTFVSSISGEVTRAVDTPWSGGETVGIAMLAKIADLSDTFSEYKVSVSGNLNSLSHSSGDVFYYPNEWDKGGNKTIYDPCPKGYRVPVSGSWDDGGTNWRQFTWGEYGPEDTTFGGFYPLIGYRSHLNGDLKFVAKYSIYWGVMPESRYSGYTLLVRTSLGAARPVLN